jgi:hypothetical protein
MSDEIAVRLVMTARQAGQAPSHHVDFPGGEDGDEGEEEEYGHDQEYRDDLYAEAYAQVLHVTIRFYPISFDTILYYPLLSVTSCRGHVHRNMPKSMTRTTMTDGEPDFLDFHLQS